jgi:hypothetical protein
VNATANNKFSHERRLLTLEMRSQLCLRKRSGVLRFADGQFDFTRPSGANMYYKPSGRRNVNRTWSANDARNQNFGVKVEHDDFGRVRRVGNVFINYDANDRIKRIGSVYIL